ncbi:MAG: hypothetical protein HY425_02960 [Candidatus Levybacteria bacterium]|nr:hypothetical protein [Candidatus Levybacteria bacterium]
MARRKTVNKTDIKRLSGISAFDAWASFTCLKCSHRNYLQIGKSLLSPIESYLNALWKCQNCGFIHSRSSDLPDVDLAGKDLPFKAWGKKITSHLSVAAQRFWKSFFTISTEYHSSYWKQCNTCGKILPASAFSGHKGWGPLEKQMECRSCKSVINANLNPKRTKEQLHESSVKRRIADLLLEGESEKIGFSELFQKFESKCFKTGKVLDIQDRDSWAIDHLLPSRFLYPLRKNNAVLLSREANGNKRDRWPSQFYTNSELKKLAMVIGANLSIISSKKPIINPNIDVNKCIDRMLNVRGATDLSRRVDDLIKLLEYNKLMDQVSPQNKIMLGLTEN